MKRILLFVAAIAMFGCSEQIEQPIPDTVNANDILVKVFNIDWDDKQQESRIGTYTNGRTLQSTLATKTFDFNDINDINELAAECVDVFNGYENSMSVDEDDGLIKFDNELNTTFTPYDSVVLSFPRYNFTSGDQVLFDFETTSTRIDFDVVLMKDDGTEEVLQSYFALESSGLLTYDITINYTGIGNVRFDFEIDGDDEGELDNVIFILDNGNEIGCSLPVEFTGVPVVTHLFDNVYNVNFETAWEVNSRMMLVYYHVITEEEKELIKQGKTDEVLEGMVWSVGNVAESQSNYIPSGPYTYDIPFPVEFP